MCINKEKTWKQTLTCSGFCCIGRFGHFFYSSNKLFIMFNHVLLDYITVINEKSKYLFRITLGS